MYKKYFLKNILIIFLFIYFSFTLTLTSCMFINRKKIYMDENGYMIYDLHLFKNGNVIIPMNQILAQGLSIIVKNDKNEIIVFDGGRTEDSNFLLNMIKNNGGIVEAWFLTHIHDDHIGALYKILNDKNYSIQIKNIYYKFADFDWYYDKIGYDAGGLTVFEDAITDYNNFIAELQKDYCIQINNNLSKGNIFNFSNVNVEVLNDMYKLEEDPINNSSITFRVEIDKSSMLILGDLGYDGGNKLLKETDKKKLKSDIVVLAHHGQNGVPTDFYYSVKPKIAIWPTTKEIYENINKKYNTNITKKAFEDMKVKFNILSYKETSIIK